MKLLHVVGTRPNFVKVAPVWRSLSETSACQQVLLHTGQHYDSNMSEVFFRELELPAPDFHLNVGSGSHAKQTATVMVAFESALLDICPDMVVVYGDVNSTLAAALVCSKMGIPVAHVEAGLRSGDRTMPEEINRLLTDHISDMLFTPAPEGDVNLHREGVDPAKVYYVGNVVIDSLAHLLPVAGRAAILDSLELTSQQYCLLTLHRPSNVDIDSVLHMLLVCVADLSRRMPIVFPVHPRTKQRIECLKLKIPPSLVLIPPLGYVEFLRLMSCSRAVLTDSGGIQAETTWLGIPSLTLRSNTEYLITLQKGTNLLVGNNLDLLTERFAAILDGDRSWDRREPEGIYFWDGRAGERIASALLSYMGACSG